MTAMTQATARTQEVHDEDDPGARNLELIRKGLAAFDAGDYAEMENCTRQMYRDAEDLLSVKRILGADWIRRMGLDTRPADEKYGHGWLDRDI